MAKELNPKELKEKIDGGADIVELAKENGISRQKLSAIVRKYELENKEEDEFPPEMFAKSSTVLRDANMGGSVVMTAAEYREYSLANGRYDGRRPDQKTQMNTGELRIAMNIVKRGDCSGADMRDHLLKKHGQTEAEFMQVANRLCMEEEASKPQDIARVFRIKV